MVFFPIYPSNVKRYNCFYGHVFFHLKLFHVFHTVFLRKQGIKAMVILGLAKPNSDMR